MLGPVKLINQALDSYLTYHALSEIKEVIGLFAQLTFPRFHNKGNEEKYLLYLVKFLHNVRQIIDKICCEEMQA
jgi:hypothetical protein